MVVGYFISFTDAVAALDELYEDGCWQGIRDDGVHRRWWRGATDMTGAGRNESVPRTPFRNHLLPRRAGHATVECRVVV